MSEATQAKTAKDTQKTAPPSKNAQKGNGVTKSKNLEHAAAVERPPADFTGAIYEAFNSVFGNDNPSQMFSLCWPGTVLAPQDYGWDPDMAFSGQAPLPQYIRTSRLMDQYVPPSPITQPDGTRVSERYKAAIGQLAPVVNEHLADLQKILRDRINQTVTVEVDGEKKEMKIVDYFYLLFGKWTQAKEMWAAKQQEWLALIEKKYPNDFNAQYQAYLEWYEKNAESWIEKINAAYYEMVAQFPLTQWDDAIAILDTHDDGNLNDAKKLLRNSIINVPPREGFYYLPTNSNPSTWPNQLKPTTGFIDMLADPELQKGTLETALARLEKEINAWRAIVPQVDDQEIKQLASQLAEKSTKFRDSQKELRDTYTENTVTAVEIFIDVYAARGGNLSKASEGEKDKVTDEVNNLASALGAESGTSPQTIDFEQIKELAGKIGDGQDALNEKQTAVIEAGMSLANTAQEYLDNKGRSSSFGWMQNYIDQLKACCEKADAQLRNFSSASNMYASYLSAAPAEPGGNPNYSPNFGNDAFPDKVADPHAKTWSEIKINIDSKQMKSERSLSTYFKQSDWGVNLFIASGGGSSVESGSDFAETFMEEESKIEIGFLATKVTIDRAWMKPEVFLNTANMFRTLDTPLSPKEAVDVKEIIKFSNESKLKSLINNNSFPAYPVAFLLVKDLCVKVNIKASETARARKMWERKKTEGGGFFCFSVSKTSVETSDEESMSSYAMGGQLIFRAPTPQISGYFLQMVPPDKSEKLTEEQVEQIGSSIGFISDLKYVLNSDPLPSRVGPKDPDERK